MADVPLGSREDQRLEFKGRGALGDLPGIGREVVAMLNAEGGLIWIGVREDNGIAVEVEPLADAEVERRRLRDYLIDAVEPPPGATELTITAEPPQVLRIDVCPRGARGPYALLRNNGRYFHLRVGDRLRAMARVELERSFRGGPQDDDESRLEGELAAEVAEVQKTAERGLWLALAPTRRLEVDLQRVRDAAYLRDPAATGSRRSGLTLPSFVAHHQGSASRLGNRGLVMEVPQLFRLEVRRDGGLRVALSLRALIGPLGDEPSCLDGLGLVEFITSVFRVAGRVLGDPDAPREEASVLGHLALLGIRGVKLRPGSAWTPGGRFTVAYAHDLPHTYDEGTDLVLDHPLRFGVDEVIGEPDRCAFRMIRRVYEAFGLSEEALPPELDRTTGRLLLRE